MNPKLHSSGEPERPPQRSLAEEQRLAFEEDRRRLREQRERRFSALGFLFRS